MASTQLAQAVGELDMDGAVGLVEEKLAAGTEPMAILGELQDGMGLVGDKFESGEYYLSELIFAGEIFKRASAPLQDAIAEAAENAVGTIVLGTVKNDIHEFGKNIAGTVLSSNGIRVVDLGVDVAPDAFVAAAREHDADVVAMSSLMVTTMPKMKVVIDALHEASLTAKPIVGGAPLTQAYADEIGAAGYAPDAGGAVRLVRELV